MLSDPTSDSFSTVLIVTSAAKALRVANSSPGLSMVGLDWGGLRRMRVRCFL